MVTSLHIGIAGAHSTGKSTLARRIEMELRATGVTVAHIGGLAKRAAELGFPKMTRHTVASTEWVITAGAAAVLEAELTAEVVIIDRTPHDAVAYMLAAYQHRREPIPTRDLDRLAALADLHAAPLAIHLATVIDPTMPLRTVPYGKDPDWMDLTFRAAVNSELHQLLKDRDQEHMAVPSDRHAAAVQASVDAVTARAAA